MGAHFGRASQPARNGPSEDELIGQADEGGEGSPEAEGERDEGFSAQRDRRLDLLVNPGGRNSDRRVALACTVLAGERRRP